MQRLRKIWQWLHKWVIRPFNFALLILALLWFYPDIRDLPEAYGSKWGDLMPDRETLLLAVASLALLWIMWMDVRPAVKRRLQEHSRTNVSEYFTVLPNIWYETHTSRAENGDTLPYLVTYYYLAVENGTKTAATLRNVQVRIYFMGNFNVCRVKDTHADQIDIRHGEVGLFELGRIVSKEMRGHMHSGSILIEKRFAQVYEYNTSHENALSFEVARPDGSPSYILSSSSGDNEWPLLAVISADDAVSLKVSIGIDVSRSPNAVRVKTMDDSNTTA